MLTVKSFSWLHVEHLLNLLDVRDAFTLEELLAAEWGQVWSLCDDTVLFLCFFTHNRVSIRQPGLVHNKVPLVKVIDLASPLQASH